MPRRAYKPERAVLYEDSAYVRLQNRLAANLRRIRNRQGLTQEEAAHQIGISTRLLQRIEGAETNVTLVTISRVAVGLGVDAAQLLAPGLTGGQRRKMRTR